MKVLLQRVSEACVKVDDETIGEIKQGYLLLTGFGHEDQRENVDKMAEKICKLRLFSDDKGKMNLGLNDIQGQILAVSQFTLYADLSKGRRPSFVDAARPSEAEALMDWFVQCLKARGYDVQTGKFAAHMKVSLLNDGPVTMMLEN